MQPVLMGKKISQMEAGVGAGFTQRHMKEGLVYSKVVTGHEGVV